MLRFFFKSLWCSVDGKQLMRNWNLPAFSNSSGVVWPYSCLLMRKWNPALMLWLLIVKWRRGRPRHTHKPRQSTNHNAFWPRRSTIEEAWYLFSSLEPRKECAGIWMPFIFRLRLSLEKCLAIRHDQLNIVWWPNKLMLNWVANRYLTCSITVNIS